MVSAIPKADFALVIEFDKDQPRPQRIFQAAEKMISAFEALDRTLVTAIDIHIEPVLMLEDIETSSLKIWLRDILNATDDQALRGLDWRPQVGKYLLRAKFVLIDFLNKSIRSGDRKRLVQLRSDLAQLAQETDVLYMPSYAPVPVPELLDRLAEVVEANSRLTKSDLVKYLAEGEEATFSIDVAWSPETIEELYVKESIAHPASAMILLVKKPDYIGTSQWEFRHGKRAIHARIADEKWLKDFQERRVDVRPGDALRCQVSQEVRYGYDNEVIGERFIVSKVEQVLGSRTQQLDLLDGDDGA